MRERSLNQTYPPPYKAVCGREESSWAMLNRQGESEQL